MFKEIEKRMLGEYLEHNRTPLVCLYQAPYSSSRQELNEILKPKCLDFLRLRTSLFLRIPSFLFPSLASQPRLLSHCVLYLNIIILLYYMLNFSPVTLCLALVLPTTQTLQATVHILS